MEWQTDEKQEKEKKDRKSTVFGHLVLRPILQKTSCLKVQLPKRPVVYVKVQLSKRPGVKRPDVSLSKVGS